MKVAANFVVQEFVPRETWERWGTNSIWFIRKELVELMQFTKLFLSDYFGEEIYVVMNNWHTGGVRDDSGYRPPSSYGPSGEFKKNPLSESLHRQGCATDSKYFVKRGGKLEEIPADVIRNIITQHEAEFMAAGLTTIEDAAFSPSWLHMDIRWTGLNRILIVKPRK
jgi:hypothetical protein